MPPPLKRVYFDTEFTRPGLNTDLVSIGFVSDEGEELYVEINDYDQAKVSPWLKENILSLLDGNGIKKEEAKGKIDAWFKEISGGRLIQLISAGKDFDNLLLYDLWAEVKPGSSVRTWIDDVPDYLNHKWHIDLDSAFVLYGVDPNIDRAEILGKEAVGNRHNALDDARMVKKCWEKFIDGKVKTGC